ncbi:MAG: type II secretion system F family protein [Verrucomicrobiales bacterium]|nr:type II secretion system F family protein [Verrucomicrobiales bacterium]
MSAFKYQAMQGNGAAVEGVIEAEDRRTALRLLGQRGLFPSRLEPVRGTRVPEAAGAGAATGVVVVESRPGGRVRRKEITAFTRKISALLGAAIPIPQALDSLAEEEENAAMREAVTRMAAAVRKGISLSGALEEHPAMFSRLYISMVRVGEEAGVLPKVMDDLAALMEHEDEVRSEVVTAVAYPVFVLGFGLVTVVVLLTFVLPKLSGMLRDMGTLPLPTRILLGVSGFFRDHWGLMLVAGLGLGFALWRYLGTAAGAAAWDGWKLRLPLVGAVFRASALARFARTLGTLVRAGVSLLPSLRIVEETIGNRVLSAQIARVAEETKGGDSLATPLRKLGLFPRGVVQMVEVGEETGRLDDMLLKVAEIQERETRGRTKTLVSLLAPVLILVVGALVGFMVIALLLPILNISRTMR